MRNMHPLKSFTQCCKMWCFTYMSLAMLPASAPKLATMSHMHIPNQSWKILHLWSSFHRI